MSGRNLFGVIVRTFGLFLILYGIYTVFYELVHFIGMPIQIHVPPRTALSFAGLYLVVGVVLIRAEWVVRFAYGPES